MKITKSQLRKIIKEEVSKVLSESLGPYEKDSWQDWVMKASQREDPKMWESDLNNAAHVFGLHADYEPRMFYALAGWMVDEFRRQGKEDFADYLDKYTYNHPMTD